MFIKPERFFRRKPQAQCQRYNPFCRSANNEWLRPPTKFDCTSGPSQPMGTSDWRMPDAQRRFGKSEGEADDWGRRTPVFTLMATNQCWMTLRSVVRHNEFRATDNSEQLCVSDQCFDQYFSLMRTGASARVADDGMIRGSRMFVRGATSYGNRKRKS
jgi:hypothetical protein